MDLRPGRTAIRLTWGKFISYRLIQSRFNPICSILRSNSPRVVGNTLTSHPWTALGQSDGSSTFIVLIQNTSDTPAILRKDCSKTTSKKLGGKSYHIQPPINEAILASRWGQPPSCVA